MDEQKLEKWLVKHTDWQNVCVDGELPSHVRMHYNTVTDLCRHILKKIRHGDFG